MYCRHTCICQQFHLYVYSNYRPIQHAPYALSIWTGYCTCWSMSALRGLITMPIADSPTARGARNMHRDFPEPVAILTNTSRPWTTGSSASSWPGRKAGNLGKYSWRALWSYTFPGQSSLAGSPPPRTKGHVALQIFLLILGGNRSALQQLTTAYSRGSETARAFLKIWTCAERVAYELRTHGSDHETKRRRYRSTT